MQAVTYGRCLRAMDICTSGDAMRISSLVAAFEHNIVTRNAEVKDLADRIQRIEANPRRLSGGRLDSILAHTKYQLDSIEYRHRGSACWVTSVVTPIFKILGKTMGGGYVGCVENNARNIASIRFQCTKPALSVEGISSMILRLTLSELCTEHQRERVSVQAVRSVVGFNNATLADATAVPLETPVRSLVNS